MQPFLPILPIIAKYPFIKLSKAFVEFEIGNKPLIDILHSNSEINKSALIYSRDIVTSILSNKKYQIKIRYPEFSFICTICEEKKCKNFCKERAINSKIDWKKCKFCGECFKNCTVEIASENYYNLKIKAKRAVLTYLFSKLFISLFGERVRIKYAICEARKYAKLLENEDENILELIASDLGLNFSLHNGFKIHVSDYLKAFTKIRTEK